MYAKASVEDRMADNGSGRCCQGYGLRGCELLMTATVRVCKCVCERERADMDVLLCTEI